MQQQDSPTAQIQQLASPAESGLSEGFTAAQMQQMASPAESGLSEISPAVPVQTKASPADSVVPMQPKAGQRHQCVTCDINSASLFNAPGHKSTSPNSFNIHAILINTNLTNVTSKVIITRAKVGPNIGLDLTRTKVAQNLGLELKRSKLVQNLGLDLTRTQGA